MTNIDIYNAIKSVLPDEFKSRYEIERTTANDSGNVRVIPNVVVVHIKPAEKPVRDMSGRIIREYKRIQFSVYTDRGGREAMESGEIACEEIKSVMDTLFNKKLKYTDNEGKTKELRIIDSEILIDTNYLGMTEQGAHRYSLEYRIIHNP